MKSRTQPKVDQAARPASQAVVPRTALFRLMSEGAAQPGVVLVSAPAGSGKTVMLQAWIGAAGLTSRTAWVVAAHGEMSPQSFWRSVLQALNSIVDAEALRMTPAPDFDPNETVARIVSVLSALDEPLVLVIDDLHELKSAEALGQLEVLVSQRPRLLTIMLATRHDPPIGLHRLRLAGGLTEVRAADLRFSLDETRLLLEASGIELPDESVRTLHERTEGWAAGLRLAALSLGRHPEPERFVAEFSGSEHTVADYLLAEVLDRQPEPVRRLLLRTSILERVNGALADVLTREAGSEAMLQALEDDNSLVTSIDASRSWFRYHHLLADLLQLELRKREPGEPKRLHHAAAAWLAEHGFPLEAVRHAQAAEEWALAARLLSDSWFSLYLDGRSETAYEVLSEFPSRLVSTDPELAALTAARELHRGSLEMAARYLDLAVKNAAAAGDRAERLRAVIAVLRLSLARQRGDVLAAIDEAHQVLAPAGIADAGGTGHEELRALTLLNLGFAEIEAFRIDEAEQHLAEGLAAARRSDRPFLEMTALSRLAITATFRSIALTFERAREAITLADAHGWSALPVVGMAYWAQAMCLVWQGRLDEAEPLLAQAEGRQQAEVEPAKSVAILHTRAMIDLMRGHDDAALERLVAAERLAARLGAGQVLTTMITRWLLPTRARLGQADEVERGLSHLSQDELADPQISIGRAWIHVIRGEAAAATAALQPLLDGSAAVASAGVDRLHAFLLDAIALDMLGQAQASKRALERALDLAEPEGMRWAFFLHPVSELLERHRRRETAHHAFVSDVLDLHSGTGSLSPKQTTGELREQLSQGELRVLRFLPSNLSAPEIAAELYLSTSTVKTHLRHIYAKLGVHGRSEAVARGRELGLLAPVATLRR